MYCSFSINIGIKESKSGVAPHKLDCSVSNSVLTALDWQVELASTKAKEQQ